MNMSERITEKEKEALELETAKAHDRFKEAWNQAPKMVRSIFYKNEGMSRQNMTSILRDGRSLETLEELLSALKDASDEHLREIDTINKKIQSV